MVSFGNYNILKKNGVSDLFGNTRISGDKMNLEM